MADTSFPFLKIARDHGVPYGDVLRLSDLIGRPTFGAAAFKALAGASGWSPIVMNAISDAVCKEQGRRHMVKEGDCRHD